MRNLTIISAEIMAVETELLCLKANFNFLISPSENRIKYNNEKTYELLSKSDFLEQELQEMLTKKMMETSILKRKSNLKK